MACFTISINNGTIVEGTYKTARVRASPYWDMTCISGTVSFYDIDGDLVEEKVLHGITADCSDCGECGVFHKIHNGKPINEFFLGECGGKPEALFKKRTSESAIWTDADVAWILPRPTIACFKVEGATTIREAEELVAAKNAAVAAATVDAEKSETED